MRVYCELCGASSDIEVEGTSDRLVDFACARCGTHHYVKAADWQRIWGAAGTDERPSAPPTSKTEPAKKKPAAADGDEAPWSDPERLSDLYALQRQSLVDVAPYAEDDTVLDAPPSVRAIVRTSDVPILGVPTPPPAPVVEAAAPRSWKKTTVIAGALALAIGALVGRGMSPTPSRVDAASAGFEKAATVAVARLVVDRPVEAKPVATVAAAPEPAPKPVARPRVVTPVAPRAAVTVAPAVTAAPAAITPAPKSLQEAIADAVASKSKR